MIEIKLAAYAYGMLTHAQLPPRCAACVVRDRALCSALSDAELPALAGAARMRELARGQTLALAGDNAPLCGNLIDGALKLAARARDGTEQVVALLFAGDFVGDVLGGPAAHDVVALTETRVCLFPRPVLADALGLTIETVSRALTRLKAAGVIATEGRRGVVLHDRGALKAMAAG